MTNVCVICAKSPAYFCKRCTSCAYCSVPCQETDYAVHKLLCRSFTDFSSHERPSLNHRRAIYAPVQGRKPCWIWVGITPDALGWDGHDEPYLDELLKLQPGEVGYAGRHPTYIRGNVLRGRKENDHVMELWQRDDVGGSLPPTNQSLNAINGYAWSTWRGPVIVMAKAGTDFDPAFYIDATLTDLRDAADYIHYFRDTVGSATDGIGSNDHWAKTVLSRDGGKVQVVRVACRAEQIARGIPEFSGDEIPKTHPAFRLADDPPSIADVLSESIPVFKEKVPANLWGSVAVPGFLDNPAVSGLYCNVGHSWSTQTTELGTVPDKWSQKVGTVLVLRRDKRDLDVKWVQALCELCRSTVMSLANVCRESGAGIDEVHGRNSTGGSSAVAILRSKSNEEQPDPTSRNEKLFLSVW